MTHLIRFLIHLWLLSTFLPIPFKGHSSYNPWTDTIFCNVAWECRHEIGHRMDWDLGQVSQSGDFQQALVVYAITEFTSGSPDYLAYVILFHPLPAVEMYAVLYQIVKGDVTAMPLALQPYYSSRPEYVTLYTCLTKHPISLCDGALAIIPQWQP